MDKAKFLKVVEDAAKECGCTIFNVDYNDDDNVFDVTIDKEGGVALEDCETVHRAVLSAFDRDVEDYALTVGSRGIDPEQADKMLSEIQENQ